MSEPTGASKQRQFSVPRDRRDQTVTSEPIEDESGGPVAAGVSRRQVQSVIEKKGRLVEHIDADATVLDAAHKMNEHHIGALVVAEGEKIVGIFTERDILNRVVAAEKNPADTRVRDVMTSPVAVCQPDTPLAACRAVMRHKRIRHLPVVEGETLAGIVSIGDLNEDENAQKDETIRWMHEYMHGEYR